MISDKLLTEAVPHERQIIFQQKENNLWIFL